MYLESFGNPRKFGRIATRVSSRKPIAAIKGGRTSAGSKAAATHTGAMAASATAIEALFRQAGVIRVNTLEESFGVIGLLSKQPVPTGNRVAILTNGGGPGIIAADACANHGLVLPQFSQETAEQLKSASSRDIRINNPLDLTASASEGEFGEALHVLARDQGNDAVMVISIPPVRIDPRKIRKVIQRVIPSFREQGKPLIACFVGQPEAGSEPGAADVPIFTFPEEAVSALAHAMEYGNWLKKPEGKIIKFPSIERDKARKLVERAMARSCQKPFWLSTMQACELLDCYGIRMIDTAFCSTAEEAVRQAAQIGFPVAVKLASDTIAHKTEVGGIALGLETKKDVKQAFEDIRGKLYRDKRGQQMEGVVVQRMVTSGVETIAGISEDPTFGPLIMFGVGGIYAELLRDFAVRLHPLTDVQARELLNSVRMSALLTGWRGTPACDTGALEEMLLRLSSLVEDMKEITEVDLNPVMAMPEGEGYWVVDAKIRLK